MKTNKFMVTLYSAIIVYISLILHKIGYTYLSNQIFSLFYGIVIAVGICGVIINNIYYEKIMKSYNVNRTHLIISDIFGHILPAIITLQYAPSILSTPITPLYLFMFNIILYSTYTIFIKQSCIYVGVPKYVFYLFFIIMMLTTYLKYFLL